MKSEFEAWSKSKRGDALTDAELAGLIQSADWGCAFLESRNETGGVLFVLRLDLQTLRGFQRARERVK